MKAKSEVTINKVVIELTEREAIALCTLTSNIPHCGEVGTSLSKMCEEFAREGVGFALVDPDESRVIADAYRRITDMDWDEFLGLDRG